jgi:hypothetical protein
VIAYSGGLTIDSVARHSRRPLPAVPALPRPPRSVGGVVERMSGRFPVPPGMAGAAGVVRRGPSAPDLSLSS